MEINYNDSVNFINYSVFIFLFLLREHVKTNFDNFVIPHPAKCGMRRYFVCMSRTFRNPHVANGGLQDEKLTNYKLQDPTICIAGCRLVHIAKNWLWKFGVPLNKIDKFFRVSWVVWCKCWWWCNTASIFCSRMVWVRCGQQGIRRIPSCHMCVNKFICSFNCNIVYVLFLCFEYRMMNFCLDCFNIPQPTNPQLAKCRKPFIWYFIFKPASRKCRVRESLYMC